MNNWKENLSYWYGVDDTDNSEELIPRVPLFDKEFSYVGNDDWNLCGHCSLLTENDTEDCFRCGLTDLVVDPDKPCSYLGIVL